MVYGLTGAFAAFSVCIFAFGMNIFALSSSLFRAFDKLAELGSASAARALIALALSVICAFLYGWQTAFLAEALAVTIFGLAIASYFVLAIEREPQPAASSDRTPISGKHDGHLLFLAYMVLIVPTTFDRAFITRFDALEAAKSYAFMGIWLTAASTVSAIFVQKFGPEMVRAQALDPLALPLARTRKNAAVLGGLLLCSTLVSLCFVYALFYETYWQKYGIDWTAVIFAATAVALQVTPLYDWTLIALDGEKELTKAALINLAAVAIGFLLCLWSGWGYPGYAASIAVGRLLQLVWADMAVGRLQRLNRFKAVELPE